jgi:hypothetical protein
LWFAEAAFDNIPDFANSGGGWIFKSSAGMDTIPRIACPWIG